MTVLCMSCVQIRLSELCADSVCFRTAGGVTCSACLVSRYGRVNYVLAQRLELLEEVKRLQGSLGVTGDMSYTCETAGYFFLYQVSILRGVDTLPDVFVPISSQFT